MRYKSFGKVKFRNILSSLTVVFLGLLVINAKKAIAQSDHLTDKEIELIRFNQEIDNRIKVYVKAIERRLLVINGADTLTENDLKNLKKDEKKWGALPKGSREKLLTNIDKILDEAIDKIDDVATRDTKSNLFLNAVHILADAARNFVPKLKAISEDSANARETALISSAIDYCTDIIEASSKVKKPSKKTKRKKKNP